MFKKLIFIVLAVFILGFLGYKYIYQEHRNIAEEKVEHQLEAGVLVSHFIKNPKKAEKDYLNKTIAVTGTITRLNTKSLILDEKIFCQFLKPIKGLELDDKTTIKGRCIGFDDLLRQVKMDQCSQIN